MLNPAALWRRKRKIDLEDMLPLVSHINQDDVVTGVTFLYDLCGFSWKARHEYRREIDENVEVSCLRDRCHANFC